MKKINLSSIAILFAIILNFQNANARKHRINFLSNYNATTPKWGDNVGGNSGNPVYNSIAAAQLDVNNVQSNDTLYLEACQPNQSHQGVTLTRPFTIIGEGFNHTQNINANTSSSSLETLLDNVTFSYNGTNSSSGSVIMGVRFDYTGIAIHVNNIIVKRCYFPSTCNIAFNANLSDIYIINNFFDNTSVNPTISSAMTFYTTGVTNLEINYNIFKRPLFVASNSLTTGGTTYVVGTCRNNMFDYSIFGAGNYLRMNCNSFFNNIVKGPLATLNINGSIPPVGVTYNTGNGATQFDTTGTTNNHIVTNMSSLFVTQGNSDDANYQLSQPGSGMPPNYPALGGGDRGPFGGTIASLRYQLSGLAPIPVIYHAFTDGIVVGGQLNVTISAKTIK